MHTGKVPAKVLKGSIFPYLGSSNPKVKIGPSIGEDGAVILNEGKYLVISTDPITGTEESIGSYAVHVNANDIASKGAKPAYMTLTIMLPVNTSQKVLKKITREAGKEAEKLGITIVGGHTEVTDMIDKPLLVGCMIGFTSKLLKAENIQEGCKIILTKGAGIEGTSILSQRYVHILESKGLKKRVINQAQKLRGKISVLKEAMLVQDRCVFLHDPTEGGILGGLHEICDRAKKGFRVAKEKIIIPPEVEVVCSILAINPLKLIGSGALLVIAKPENSDKILTKLDENGVDASLIGEITSSITDRNLDRVEQDELWRIRQKLG